MLVVRKLFIEIVLLLVKEEIIIVFGLFLFFNSSFCSSYWFYVCIMLGECSFGFCKSIDGMYVILEVEIEVYIDLVVLVVVKFLVESWVLFNVILELNFMILIFFVWEVVLGILKVDEDVIESNKFV